MQSTIQLVFIVPFSALWVASRDLIFLDLIGRYITWTTVQPLSLMWLKIQSFHSETCSESESELIMLQNDLGSKSKNILSS